MNNPCEGCALTEGSAANLEPHNNIKARLCVLAGLPFYCHHNQDWQAPDANRGRTAAEMRAEEIKICAGWKREVAKLASRGYFKQHNAMKKAYGQVGLEALEIFTSKNCDNEDKGEALQQLEDVLVALDKEQVKV